MSNAKRILLVQLYSNGDCLYATAVARQIKQDFPGCHLNWAIAGFCQQIIDHNPFSLFDLKKYYKQHLSYSLDEQKKQGMIHFLELIKLN